MTHLRLFIAFDAPQEVKLEAAAIQDKLRQAQADVSWERREKLHCTVKFLGDTASDIVPSIEVALSQIGQTTPPFTVRYRGTGCFPGKRDPRILWLGIENPDGRLDLLFMHIERAMFNLGFTREDRRFHPHVTLGRVRSRRNQGNLLEMLETVTFDSAIFKVDEIMLMKSDLKHTGSAYTRIKSVRLVGNQG